ncbi:PilZ domain-containing protein [Thermocrinis minervae]|uniref:C-di-GMP-binding flagellar brake protein YcgR, contains PilZNR and PilZ domains n=1 Tax=Thermocrinis minervae TaxID=381751 RepID=A0A1M6STD8_9AQUI|nr:PilZ domain-containing protein [Thermocrinis minervae]SHK47838.1 c-di-GMP-binding flagellar brake protein YcgR, contains PilZNR and PilZ domains [Thermocrinis minervae]
MDVKEVLRTLQPGQRYELLTVWKEIPIRTKLLLKWVSPNDMLVGFDYRECVFKNVIQKGHVYLKVGDMYLETVIFSNIRDELVLEVLNLTSPPPVVMREFVRVEPSEEEPVYVDLCLEDRCIVNTKAVDISESGVGIHVSPDYSEELMKMLNFPTEDLLHKAFDVHIKLPSGHVLEAKGELRNIIKDVEGAYIRLGFLIKLSPKDEKLLRSYILKRQKEIIDKLKSL